jgi:hypothetical protein
MRRRRGKRGALDPSEAVSTAVLAIDDGRAGPEIARVSWPSLASV